MKTSFSPTSTFRPLTYEVLELVREWRNSPRVRTRVKDQAYISREQQESWFSGLREDPDRSYFVYYQNDKPVGILSYVGILADECIWGCHLGEEAVWPGSGLILHIAAMDYAFDDLGLKELYSEVLATNKGPQILQRHFGAETLPERQTESGVDGSSIELLRYRQTSELWRRNRDQILGKLPKQVQSAVVNIEFDLE